MGNYERRKRRRRRSRKDKQTKEEERRRERSSSMDSDNSSMDSDISMNSTVMKLCKDKFSTVRLPTLTSKKKEKAVFASGMAMSMVMIMIESVESFLFFTGTILHIEILVMGWRPTTKTSTRRLGLQHWHCRINH